MVSKRWLVVLLFVVALMLLPCVSYAGGCGGGGGFNSFNSFSYGYQAAFAPQFVPVYQAPVVQATPVYQPAFAAVQFAPAYSTYGVQAQVFQRNVNVNRGQRAPLFRGRSVSRNVNVQRNVAVGY
jgi:hypothetical protein